MTAAPCPTPVRRCETLVLPGIFLLAFGLRCLALWQLRDAPFADMLFIDSREYDLWARRIAGGDLLGSGVFYQAPLYPYFLGLVYALFGPSLLAARVVQAVLGSAACVFLALAGRRFFNAATGTIAGLLLALYPTAIFLDGLLHKSVLDALLLSLLLWALGSAASRPAPRTWLLTGILLGAFSLTRENALVLAPVAALAIVFPRPRPSPAAAVRHLGLLALGLFLAIAPVAARNLVVGGQLFLTTSSAGSVFYSGNNPLARGTVTSFQDLRDAPPDEREAVREKADSALGRPLTPREVSAYWWGKSWEFIRTRPGDWLGLMGWKALLLVNTLEFSDTYDQYTSGDWSWLLRWLTAVFPFGVLLPAAAAGAVLTWRDLDRTWLLHATVVVYGASVVLFQVSTRYRYPLVMPLAIFAAAGLCAIAERLRSGRRDGLRMAAAVAAVTAVVANWPVAPRQKEQMRAVVLNSVAVEHLRRPGGSGAALPYLQEVIRINPSFLHGQYNMALALRDAGRPAEAIEHLRKAAALSPAPEIILEMGNMYQRLGMIPDAIRCFEQALEKTPRFVGAWYNLGVLMQKQGRSAEAVSSYAKVLEIKPDHPEAHNNLGVILLDGGKIDEASGHFREALRGNRQYAAAWNNLGAAALQAGRFDEAASHFRSALQIAPGHAGALANLERAERLAARPRARD